MWVVDSKGDAVSGFAVQGSHTYASQGSDQIAVTINDNGGSTARTSSSAAVAGPPVNANLIGFYNFDETSGTIAHDSSGSGNDGTLAPGAVFDPGAGLDGNGALELPNAGFVSIPGISFNGTDVFSIQAWIELPPGDTAPMS